MPMMSLAVATHRRSTTPPTGYSYRYRAADVASPPSNGSAVGSMAFQTGSITLTNGNGSQQPVWLSSGQNGRPALRFDGNDDYLQANFTGPSAVPYTLVFVCNIQSISGVRKQYNLSALGSGHNVQGSFNNDSANTWEMYAGSAFFGGTTSVGMKVLAWVWNGGSSFISVNNSTVASGNPGTDSVGGMSVGANYDGSNATQMDVYEVMLYPSALSSTQLTQMRTYATGFYNF